MTDASSIVESYAENLIDELFEDVNRLLDPGASVPPASTASLHPSHPAYADPSQAIAPPSASALDADLDHEGSASHFPRGNSSNRLFGQSVDRLLLIAAIASLGITMMLWLAIYGRQRLVASAPGVQSAQTQSDQAFLDYMERSLTAIDHKVEVEKRTAALSSPSSSSALPGVAVSPLPPPPPSLAQSSERVYIPVYQPPQQPLVPSLVGPQQPVPFQAAAPAPSSPPASQPAQTAAPPSAPAAPAPTAAAANVAPASNYSLVALLQMGDRSAAIFEFDDTARRIEVGEQIGSSGWTLVSVSREEALIRRNGDVRSVYIGQSF